MIETQDAVGVAVELAGSLRTLVVGAKYGFAIIDTVTGKMKYIAKTYANDEEAQRYVIKLLDLVGTGQFKAVLFLMVIL